MDNRDSGAGYVRAIAWFMRIGAFMCVRSVGSVITQTYCHHSQRMISARSDVGDAWVLRMFVVPILCSSKTVEMC